MSSVSPSVSVSSSAPYYPEPVVELFEKNGFPISNVKALNKRVIYISPPCVGLVSSKEMDDYSVMTFKSGEERLPGLAIRIQGKQNPNLEFDCDYYDHGQDRFVEQRLNVRDLSGVLCIFPEREPGRSGLQEERFTWKMAAEPAILKAYKEHHYQSALAQMNKQDEDYRYRLFYYENCLPKNNGLDLDKLQKLVEGRDLLFFIPKTPFTCANNSSEKPVSD